MNQCQTASKLEHPISMRSESSSGLLMKGNDLFPVRSKETIRSVCFMRCDKALKILSCQCANVSKSNTTIHSLIPCVIEASVAKRLPIPEAVVF